MVRTITLGVAAVVRWRGAAVAAGTCRAQWRNRMSTARERIVSELQSGIVAFLFTDIEGSTRLWESNAAGMSSALAWHDALLHRLIAAHDGRVFKTAGDAFCAVFAHPARAIAAAIACQRGLEDAATELAVPLKVRMAIHAGHAESRGDDFFGPPLNRVARLLATAHGAQILVSRAATELARGEVAAEVGLRDLGAFALKDLQQPERIYQVTAPGLPSEFPALRTPERLLQSVPQPATGLIGREAEVQAARALMGMGVPDASAGSGGGGRGQVARLVTLTGPGGAGKTRLAMHLARELGVEFGDGARFVPLAALHDPALVPVAIAAALEPIDAGGETAMQAILSQLRDRHLLLVLDNFEQVMGAAGVVAELLRGCPRLSVLVTSRERLNLFGEHELPIPALSLPERPRTPSAPPSTPGAANSVEAISRSPAVRLFVERAQVVKPGFAVTEENADTVAEICARLDGLPLAIELAAARVRLLTPRALLDRFDRRLDVLSRGPRDLPERQQTMRDTIAWSYELLDPEEQRLFTDLAVFVGGASVGAAVAVAGDPGALDAELEGLELLEALADKSLLAIGEGGEPRIAMLETIRDFALERLAASEERDAVHARHARYFLGLAEETEPLLEGRDQTALLPRLDREQANLRAAIAWLRDNHHVEEALRLSGALWRYWWLRGDMGEGRATLESLLAEASAASPRVRAKALNGAGVLAESQGDCARASRLHQESLDLSRRSGDLRGVAWSLNNLGVVEITRGGYERARELLEESLAVAEEVGDTLSMATAYTDLGQLAHLQGEYTRAADLLTRGLVLFRQLGDESHMARALNNLGTVANEQGDLERARRLLQESLDLHRSVGDRMGIAGTLNNLAGVLNKEGESQVAQGLYLESHTLAVEGGNRLYAAIAMENLAGLTKGQGDAVLARTRYQDALGLFHETGDEQGIVDCLAKLALIDAEAGDDEAAVRSLAAVTRMRDQSDPLSAPEAADAATSLLRERLGEAGLVRALEAVAAANDEEVIARAIAAGPDGAITPTP